MNKKKETRKEKQEVYDDNVKRKRKERNREGEKMEKEKLRKKT